MNSIFKNLKADFKVARKMRLPWWGVLSLIVCSFFVAWLFDSWGRLDLTLPVENCIVVAGFIVVLKWRLRVHAWFWIAIIVVVALHVPVIWFVPWTTKWVPAVTIAGIDTVDFCVMLVVLDFIEKYLEPSKAKPRENSGG